MDELCAEFIAETREMLDSLTREVVHWERVPEDRDILDSLFRFFHTIKGSCGFLHLTRFERLAHAAEELLDDVRTRKLRPDAALISAVLDLVDHIAVLTSAIEHGDTVEQVHDETLLSRLHAVGVMGAGAAVESGGNVTGTTGGTGSGHDVPVPEGSQSRTPLRTVRVSLDLLDNMMGEVSDLVLARNELLNQIAETPSHFALDQAFGRLSTTIGQLRDSISALRLQPIDRLFAFLPRVVRDAATRSGKAVDLAVHDSNVEIDREMFEVMRDPLTHIVRNAIDHGIEGSAARIEAGKPVRGRIAIRARQSGNQILVTVEDDGRGVDLAALRTKALRLGVIDQPTLDRMSERQQLELMMTPGLSTATAVTDISGRGVGMDVVRSNIMAIGGSIEIDSRPGCGLALTLSVPLTLTIIAGLILSSGGQSFVLSRSSVVEVLDLASPHVTRGIGAASNTSIIRGRRLPIAELWRLLGIDDAGEDRSGGRYVVLVRPAVGHSFGLIVDEVTDSQDFVVRPLAPQIGATGMFGGSSLPDSGKPILLLDPSGLSAAILPGVQEDAPPSPEIEQPRPVDQGEPVIIFTDLDGGRRAARMTMVDRVEAIIRDRLVGSGDNWQVIDGDRLIPLLGVNARGAADKAVLTLRLSDGALTCYQAITEAVDFRRLAAPISPAADDPQLEGRVIIDGEAFGLVTVEGLIGNVSRQTSRDCPSSTGWLDDAGRFAEPAAPVITGGVTAQR